MPLIMDLYPEGEANPMNKDNFIEDGESHWFSALSKKKKDLFVMCSLY